MAKTNGDAGVEIGGSSGGQRKGRRAYPDWHSADRDAERRTELHPLAPAEEGEKGVVYIMRDAAGAIKVGFTLDLAQRLWALQAAIGKARCPLRLVRAVRLPSLIAGRVERRTHKLLASAHIQGEWFRTTKRDASDALDEAVRQIVAGVKLPRRPRGVKEDKGAPEADFTAAHFREAKAIWRNTKDYPTWPDTVAPLAEIVSPNGQKFTTDRAYKLFGKRL
jgi:predicted GIY-YIG superfamily endonuclease